MVVLCHMRCFEMKLKEKVFKIIQPGESDRIASKIFDIFIMSLILLSVVSVFLSTFEISRKTIRCLMRIEFITTYIFTVEYLLRIWTADLLYPECSRGKARLRYFFSGMALIDLLAILPFYLPMIIPMNLLGLRAIRLVRLLRLLKFNRYSEALSSICVVLRKKMLSIFAALFMVWILLIISSLLIYFAEHDAQPDQFRNAFSGLWWAVATLTTVGYGDIYPITVAGKFLGAVIAILGIGMVAIPTGILSSGFIEHLNKTTGEDENEEVEIKYCPHCGKKLR